MSETVTNVDDIQSLASNKMLGPFPRMQKSKIVFEGENNILFCEEGVSLESSTIRFCGSNGLVMLGKNKHKYIVDFQVNNNCTIVVGRDCYFNGALHAITSEECSITIGSGCLFSFGIWMRTADPHLVYDIEEGTRINPSRSIVIGDHVWIGQNAMVLKGSMVGSGSIIGAMSVVAGKSIPSNESWAGNPAKVVRKGIFWEGSCVHSWTAEKTEAYKKMDGHEFIFETDGSALAADFVESSLSAGSRLDCYLSNYYCNAMHDSFAIAER